MRLRKIDLENLAAKAGFQGKHADYLLIAGDTLVIVEETSRAKTDDVKKLQETINAIQSSLLGSYLRLKIKPSKIIAVIHSPRRVDTMIAKLLTSKTKKNTVYQAASCNNHLAKILEKYGIQLNPTSH